MSLKNHTWKFKKKIPKNKSADSNADEKKNLK